MSVVNTGQYDVIIAGGGITGLTLACALRDTGLRIGVIACLLLVTIGGVAYLIAPGIFDLSNRKRISKCYLHRRLLLSFYFFLLQVLQFRIVN